MCGFAGIYLLDPAGPATDLEPRIRRMAQSIAHRGPDAQSELVQDHIAIGFRRLAIVDLVTGDQPVHFRLTKAGRASIGSGLSSTSPDAMVPHSSQDDTNIATNRADFMAVTLMRTSVGISLQTFDSTGQQTGHCFL